MLIRAKAAFRNQHMLSARSRLGLSQKALASLIGRNYNVIGMIEKFDYSFVKNQDILLQLAERISGILEIGIDQVIPPELYGLNMNQDMESVSDIKPSMLIEFKKRESMRILRSAEKSFSEKKEINREIRESLKDAYKELSFRERAIMEHRYPFDNTEPKSLKKVGKMLNITRERVRQIERSALSKLKNDLKLQLLNSIKGCAKEK